PAHARSGGRTDALTALARATDRGRGGAVRTAGTLAPGQITVTPPAGRAHGGRAVGCADRRSSVHATCSAEATCPSSGQSPGACPARAPPVPLVPRVESPPLPFAVPPLPAIPLVPLVLVVPFSPPVPALVLVVLPPLEFSTMPAAPPVVPVMSAVLPALPTVPPVVPVRLLVIPPVVVLRSPWPRLHPPAPLAITNMKPTINFTNTEQTRFD